MEKATSLRTNIIWVILSCCLIVLVGIGGPRLSAFIHKKYKATIDQHGIITKAAVYKKGTHKGNTTHFRYSFKDKIYKNDEAGGDMVFNNVEIGDSIIIKVDSLQPDDSYIIEKAE